MLPQPQNEAGFAIQAKYLTPNSNIPAHEMSSRFAGSVKIIRAIIQRINQNYSIVAVVLSRLGSEGDFGSRSVLEVREQSNNRNQVPSWAKIA
jgi:hypothetical protein